MEPLDSISTKLEALSLKPTSILKKSDAEKYLIARQLAEQILEMHHNGYVHREIHLNIILESGDKCFFDDKAIVQEASVSKDAGILAHDFLTLPPERNSPPFKGDWFKGDIYALGIVFCQLAGLEPTLDVLNDPKLRALLDKNGEDAQYLFYNDPLAQNDHMTMLSAWMIHSNPNKRPNIDTVCKILYDYSQTTLPQFYEYSLEEIKAQQTNEKLEKVIKNALKRHKELFALAHIVAKLFTSPKCGYVPRYLSESNFKVHCSQEHKLALFLPKEKQQGGSFKVSRTAFVLLVEPEKATLRECHVLTSLKKAGDVRPDYKHGFSREMDLYKRIEDLEIFPKHIASFGYEANIKKRLGIYEHIPYGFRGWMKTHKSNEDYLQLATSMCQTLAILHNAGLAHRDFKPSNMLVRKDGKVLLCDPDSVCVDKVWERFSLQVGTPNYRSPERACETFAGSWLPADAFALGCVVYELAFKNPVPWRDADETTSENLKKTHVITVRNNGDFNFLKELALRLLDPDAQSRLTTKEAAEIIQMIKARPNKNACDIQ